MERIGASIRGIYRDIIRGPDGNLIHDSGWVHNEIVDGCRILLAGFMGNESTSGIEFLAVGQGEDSWDDGIPDIDPADLAKTTHLVSPFPLDSVEPLEFAYLDEGDTVVSDPTSRLQITATLEPGHPVPPSVDLETAPLREFGLFGSFNGTGYMINYVRHAVIHKDTSATLIRVIRLYF